MDCRWCAAQKPFGDYVDLKDSLGHLVVMSLIGKDTFFLLERKYLHLVIFV